MSIRPMIAWFLLWGVFAISSQGRSQQPPAERPHSEEPVAQSSTLSTTPVNRPRIDPSKEADIRKLMDIGGSRALATQSLTAMKENIRPLMTSSLPPGGYRAELIELFFERFLSKADLEQIVDMTVPIYDRHFSHEEIRGLIQFYGTPLGQNTLTVVPKIMAESQAAGREWGQRLGQESFLEVLREHPDLARALERATKLAGP